jgi:hypothetical protein
VRKLALLCVALSAAAPVHGQGGLPPATIPYDLAFEATLVPTERVRGNAEDRFPRREADDDQDQRCDAVDVARSHVCLPAVGYWCVRRGSSYHRRYHPLR